MDQKYLELVQSLHNKLNKEFRIVADISEAGTRSSFTACSGLVSDLEVHTYALGLLVSIIEEMGETPLGIIHGREVDIKSTPNFNFPKNEVG